jgi:hypothetical protein
MNEPLLDFIEVARLEEIAPGTSRFVRVAGHCLALFNVDGTIYAIDDSSVDLYFGPTPPAGKEKNWI